VSISGTAGPLPQGSKGDQGSKGNAGAPGPPGRDAKVKCKVKKLKVTCQVVLARAAAKARIPWRLIRHGHTVAHGVALAQRGKVTLKLSDFSHFRRGRYTLRIAGRHHATTIVIG
jgi:hypothetical protein